MKYLLYALICWLLSLMACTPAADSGNDHKNSPASGEDVLLYVPINELPIVTDVAMV